MTDIDNKYNNIAVLGAGITGLTAAYLLHHQGQSPVVIERDNSVGGLAKTIDYNGFKFDLGGHRFLTNNHRLESFVKALLNRRYLIVPRSSTIYLNNSYIKYPLEPLDTFHQLGYLKSMQFVYDYIAQKLKSASRRDKCQDKCLQDWVINRFGNALYKAFFKDYSEKVWGIDCTQIDSDWIAKRIQNLNLGKTIKSALFKNDRKKYATLTDKFLYPTDGIGSITDNLGKAIDSDNLFLGTQIKRLQHDNGKINTIYIKRNNRLHRINAQTILSTIPITTLVKLLEPRPPAYVIEAANRLRSRDLILVTLMLNQKRLTKDSWIYFPEKHFPFGRIHEPKNWSLNMAPSGKTSIVTEHFCFRDDETWLSSDKQLIERSINSLCKLNIINKKDVIDAVVVKVKNAYPLFEIGYRDNSKIVSHYLAKFSNLILAGRTGKFRYYNMDQAMLSAVDAVEMLTKSQVDLSLVNETDIINVSNGEQDEMRAYHTGLVT